MSVGVIILAGGKSSRMGTDKGLIKVNNKCLIEYVIDACLPLSDNILIISNQKEYQQFNFPVHADLIKDKGPLGGIYTGLSHSEYDHNVILSCDTPMVKTSTLKRLLDALRPEINAVVPTYEDKVHPLMGGYHKNILPTVGRQIVANQLKLMDLLNLIKTEFMASSAFEKSEFLNLNQRLDVDGFKSKNSEL